MMEPAEHMERQEGTSTSREGKYLTFTLNKEEYGIGILKVKEIIGMMPITQVPQTPEYLEGVINLRGKVIPVIDLRVKFGMDRVDYDERACIVVVETEAGSDTALVGIVVDSVSEVLNIRAELIEETPTFSGRLTTGYILGMAKTESSLKILLDIDKVIEAQAILPGMKQ
jgi:purine-binding chemotaxis protein CheW